MVITIATNQRVSRRITGQAVITCFTCKVVRTAAAAINHVITGTATNGIGLCVTGQAVICLTTNQTFDADQTVCAVSTRVLAACFCQVDRNRGCCLRIGRIIEAGTAIDGVIALATFKRVIAGKTQQRVRIRAAGDCIAAVCSFDDLEPCKRVRTLSGRDAVAQMHIHS